MATTPPPLQPDAPPVTPPPPADPPQNEAAADPLVGPLADPDIDLFCPGCGYDLRALQGDACPECGISVDLEKLRESSIPWVLAEGFIAKAWGFLRTCDRATLRPTRFCREISRPVSLREAQRFRRIMIWLVWLTLLAAAAADWVAIIYVEGQQDDWGDFFRETGINQPCLLAAGALLLLLFLVGLTGLHLYALHPRALTTERQNRAVALGHYACAPLGLLPAILALRITGATLASIGRSMDVVLAEEIGMTVWGVTWLLVPVVALLFLRNCYVFAGKAAQRSGFAQLGLALLIPLLWLGWGLLLFVALPAVAGFIYLFFLTG